MATEKRVVRKNGIPVKRFWHEKATKNTRESHITTYPVYFHGLDNTVWSLTDGAAPTSLSDAIGKARAVVEAPDMPQTHARIYEMRLMHRVGVEFDWKLHETEQRFQRAREETQQPTIRLISTTATEMP